MQQNGRQVVNSFSWRPEEISDAVFFRAGLSKGCVAWQKWNGGGVMLRRYLIEHVQQKCRRGALAHILMAAGIIS